MMEPIDCGLCPLDCKLSDGEVGKCKVRGNVGGEVVPLAHGLVSTAIVGPIEQKPLYHYYPGSSVLSLGGFGCNMFCDYCCPAGTLIRTSSGLVPIEQIRDGDEIVAVDGSHSDPRPVSAHVGHVFDREAEELIELQVDGRTILLTPEHPVLTSRGWIEAGNLTEEDEVLCDASFK